MSNNKQIQEADPWWVVEMPQFRDAIIEECARVVAKFGKRFEYAPHVAAAIRALKDRDG